MSVPNRNRTPRQSGYSLAEILVAMAVFTVVILAALMVYDRSNKVFKQSVEASDMQQNTRVAFDRLVADLRMTGFDYDRDGTPFGALAQTWKGSTTYTTGMLVQPTNANGHTYVCIAGGTSSATEPTWPTDPGDTVVDGGTLKWQEDGDLQYQQPDEQIEFAGKHAIAIRANFNYETATGPCPTNATTPCENGREPALQSTPFPIVTTANNEIVTYALKPVKWASGESANDLVFYADVASEPRDVNPLTDQKEDTVTITGVDLCDNGCNSPPYTLYRYTLNKDGTPDAGTPVADNIRSMTFRYYNTTDAKTTDELASYPEGAGRYDGAKPDDPLIARDNRAGIRAIEIRLVGMNSQPDSKYTDASDTVAPHYRKLELTSLIVPRNMGRRGMKEYSTDLPGEPVLETVCAGACNAVFVTWKAPTTGGDIDSYAILYDTDPCTISGGISKSPAEGFQHSEEVGLSLEGSIGRNTTLNKDYYFAVQAINKFGAATSNCFGPVKVINKTKPAPLAKVEASTPAGAVDTYLELERNQVNVLFPAASANVSGQDMLACDGGGVLQQTVMPPSEKRYYEIRRSTNATFNPDVAGSSTLLVDAGTALQPILTTSGMVLADKTAANCTDYYYRIRVVDYCARDANYNDPVGVALAQSTWTPAFGTNGTLGRAETGLLPKAPVLSLAGKSCAGMSNNCTLNFTWSAVTKNASEEDIAIAKYRLLGYPWDSVTNDWGTTATINVPYSNGELAHSQFVNGSTEKYKFQVRAEDCNNGPLSNSITFPCDFAGGTLAATLEGTTYGGAGTAANPYVIEGNGVKLTASVGVKEMSLAAFYVDTGAQIGATTVRTGTNLTSEIFSLPNTDDGEAVKLLFAAVDANGCTSSTEIYVIDQAAPACSLEDAASATIVSTPKPGSVVNVTIKNEDTTNAIKVQKVVVGFNVTNQMKGLTSVSFDGSSVTVNCNPNTEGAKTVTVTASTEMTVAANSSKIVAFSFNQGNLNGTSPITSLCVVYQASTGDVVRCSVFPGSGTCTEPATSCQ